MLSGCNHQVRLCCVVKSSRHARFVRLALFLALSRSRSLARSNDRVLLSSTITHPNLLPNNPKKQQTNDSTCLRYCSPQTMSQKRRNSNICVQTTSKSCLNNPHANLLTTSQTRPNTFTKPAPESTPLQLVVYTVWTHETELACKHSKTLLPHQEFHEHLFQRHQTLVDVDHNSAPFGRFETKIRWGKTSSRDPSQEMSPGLRF